MAYQRDGFTIRTNGVEPNDLSRLRELANEHECDLEAVDSVTTDGDAISQLKDVTITCSSDDATRQIEEALKTWDNLGKESH